MSSNWRRFEVLLPLRFNDGREVSAEWLAEAVLEVVDHFGAASYETQKVEGHWRHGGVIYRRVALVADSGCHLSYTTCAFVFNRITDPVRPVAPEIEVPDLTRRCI